MNIGQLTAYLGLNTDEFSRNVAQTEQKMKKVGQNMRDIGVKMSLAISVPLGLAGAASFKMYKDFDSNMSKIVGLVGIGKGQVDAWKDSVMDLAFETGKSAVELSDALFFITSAGLRGADAMNALEVSAKAAAAGLGDTAMIADVVTSAMNAYGAETLSAEQATDILVATVREGKAEAAEIAQVMGSVLPIASEMGVTFDQVGAAIAAMTRTGTNAATATTQLRGILAAFIKPTKQAEKAMYEMGTSSEEMRRIISEDGLMAALEKLKDMQTEYGDETMSLVLPNIRALSGALDIVGMNMEDNIQIFENMKDTTGALAHAYETASETAEFKYNKALNQMKTSSIALGESVNMALTPVMEVLGNTLENVGKKFDSLDDNTKLLVGGFGLLLVKAGPFLATLGQIMMVLPGLAKAKAALTLAQMKLNAAIYANPYVAAAAAIAVLTAAMVIFIRNGNQVSKIQREINSGMADANAGIMQEQKSLDYLFKKLKETNEGSVERRELMADINERYGEYLPNLLTESSTLEQIEAAQARANVELEKSGALKAREAQSQEMLNKVYQKQAKEIITLEKELQKQLGVSAEQAADLVAESVERGGFLLETLRDNGIESDKWSNKMRNGSRRLQLALGEEKEVLRELDTAHGAWENRLKKNEKEVQKLEVSARATAEGITEMEAASKIFSETFSNITEKGIEEIEKMRLAHLQARESYIEGAMEQIEAQGVLGSLTGGEYSKMLRGMQELQDAQRTQIDLIEEEHRVREKAGTGAGGKSIGTDEAAEEARQRAADEEKAVLDMLESMVEARRQAGLTELQLLDEKELQMLMLYQNYGLDKQNVLEHFSNVRKDLMEEERIKSQAIEEAIHQNKLETAQRGLEALQHSMLTEDELQRQHLENQVQAVRDAWMMGIIPTIEEANELIEQIYLQHEESYTKKMINMQGITEQAIGGMMDDIVTGNRTMAESFASMVSQVLQQIAKIIAQLAAQAIMGLFAKEASTKGLLGVGLAAAGVGGMLMAVQAATSRLQGLATGGQVTKSGAFLVGEQGPEVVNLPAGSAVTPNHMLGGMAGDGVIARTEVRGKDLLIILERAMAENIRR